jgi:hypothetical protein
VLITENIPSTGAVLPGRQSINCTILQKHWLTKPPVSIRAKRAMLPTCIFYFLSINRCRYRYLVSNNTTAWLHKLLGSVVLIYDYTLWIIIYDYRILKYIYSFY